MMMTPDRRGFSELYNMLVLYGEMENNMDTTIFFYSTLGLNSYTGIENEHYCNFTGH